MMTYVSTRGGGQPVSFSDALERGLAADGGLYVPQQFPHIHLPDFASEQTLAELAAKLLAPFLEGDQLAPHLVAICEAAFNFPVPLRFRDEKNAVLELFHGPTAAFKDIGARFLAECFSRLPLKTAGKKRTVIVATSGDTGGAVAGAFSAQPDIETYVLFPEGRISARQEKQIACWGPSVKAFAVNGSFDDCQRLVKEVLSSPNFNNQKIFISANSISIGRLLPQMTYYAKASLDYRRARKKTAGFIIPTGNLGNATAALWAKHLGFPIGPIVLATNANHAIRDFFATGVWTPHASLTTLANAMDVGSPSNIERVRHLYPEFDALTKDLSAVLVDDALIAKIIRESFAQTGEIFCPHTATAIAAEKQRLNGDWIAIATAHPAKFETVVEPLIQQTIETPPKLTELLNRQSVVTRIEPTLAALALQSGI